MFFNYYVPPRILFGRGQLSHLHEQSLPGKKALIVTTNGNSIKKYGYLERVQKELSLAGCAYAVFDKILPNPVKRHVMEGAAFAKANDCDFVLGLGGGSSIDSAKAIAIMATNEGDYWDYMDSGAGAAKPIPNHPLPIVAITTTAGTGTEADPWTVITNEDTNEKIGGGDDTTFPFLSIVDPDLMMTVPAHLTAYQGFDALFHSTEGYIARVSNPISDLYAHKAIELIGASLAQAVTNGEDETAREHVALANTLSGMVECTSSCISEHSIEHALSAYHPDLPHGAGLIMISLAYYTHFAQCGACDSRLIEMAKALGKKDASKPMDFVDALAELQQACHVDTLKLSDYGIHPDEFRTLAKNSFSAMGGLFERDPAPLSEDDVVAILEKSYK